MSSEADWPNSFPPLVVRKASVASFALIVRDAAVLFVRHAYGLRLWGLPGGFVEPGETTEVAAAREAKEESGFDVELLGLLGVADRDALILFTHLARVVGGELRLQDAELSEARWLRLDELHEIEQSAFGWAITLSRDVLSNEATPTLRARIASGPDGSHVFYGR